jgi:hypothetical protein
MAKDFIILNYTKPKQVIFYEYYNLRKFIDDH